MTEEIKKAFEEAATDDEKKAVLEKYKDSMRTLTEEELDDITGGRFVIRVDGVYPKITPF